LGGNFLEKKSLGRDATCSVVPRAPQNDGMCSKNIEYWVGFSLIPAIGRAKLSHLENYFGNLENAWHAAPAALLHTDMQVPLLPSFPSVS